MLVFVLYKLSGNFVESLWLAFLATWFFLKGRYFQIEVVSPYDWEGNRALVMDISILYSDMILVILLYWVLTRKKLRNLKISNNIVHATFLFLIGFIFASAFSVFFSEYFDVSLYYYLQLIKLVVIFLLSIYVFQNKSLLEKSLEFLGVYVLTNALLVLLQFVKSSPLGILLEDNILQYGVYASESNGLYRPGGFFSDPNMAATYFAVLLPLVLVLTITTKSIKSNYGWIAVFIIISALIATASRTAWVIAFTTSFMCFTLVKRKNDIFIPEWFARYWKVMLLMMLIIFSPVLISRIESMRFMFDVNSGLNYRIDHIKVGFNYFLTSPSGIGLGVIPYMMAKDFPPSVYNLQPNMLHNLPAQVGGETGIIGFTFFSIFLLLIIKLKINNLIKEFSPLTLGLLLSFFASLFMYVFFPWFLHPRMSVLLWIFAGYGLLSKQKSRVYS